MEDIDCFAVRRVKKELAERCSGKACGVDEVNPHVLKSCASGFARPLSLIFIKSINEGYVPKKWRDANVTPIFKKAAVFWQQTIVLYHLHR